MGNKQTSQQTNDTDDGNVVGDGSTIQIVKAEDGSTVSRVIQLAGDLVQGDKIIYEGTKPVSVSDLLNACQSQVNGVLYDVRHKYDHKLYVNRAIERELNDSFNTALEGPAPNCFLIVAPAGSGKTNLLCELARLRVTQQPVLLLMGGNLFLDATTGLLAAIQSELQAANSKIHFLSPEDSLHTLHRLAEEMDRDALLILDAINEHDRPAQMRKAVEDLLRKTRGRRIKLVVTCRDYYWGLFKGRFWEGATVNSLPAEADEQDAADDFSRFATDEHERALPLYLDHYQITGGPVADAAEQCRHPLLLRFFCEAYRGQDVGQVEDIRLKELFDHYWDQKLLSIAVHMIQQGAKGTQDELTVKVGECLLSLAAHMLHHNVRAIPKVEMPTISECERRRDDQLSMYGRIRDEFIIVEEKERGRGRRKILQVAFVYEEFMEYVMARSLMLDWDQANLDEEAILAKIEALTGKYESFAQIVGVMVYLALILKEERDLALWSLLLNRGESWQKVVLEAFRKLPEEQLDVGVFDALEEMLATGDESILVQVLDTLKVKRVGQAAPTSMVDVLGKLTPHSRGPICRRAVLALGNMTAELALPVLIQALDYPRSSLNAIVALKKQGFAQAVELADASLKDDTLRARIWAIERLGQLRDSRAIELLMAALKDSYLHMVRSKAAEGLGLLGDARAVEPLIAALRDQEEIVRRGAAEALGKLGDARAVEPLIAALSDSHASVRREAAEALGLLADVRAVGSVVAAFRDDHEDVRRSATRSLGQIWQLPDLIQLGSSDGIVRLRAAEALGKLGDARAVEPLITALRDDHAGVRRSATRALGQIWQLPDLTQLGSSDGTMRSKAALILGELGDARAVEPLIAALKDEHENVRSEATLALGLVGNVALKPLIAGLEDSDASVRQGVAEALELLEDARAVDPLIAALKDKHESVRRSATRALGHIWQLPDLTRLGSSDRRTRSKAAKALGELKDTRAVEPLIATLKDSNTEVRSEATSAVALLGNAAVEPLIAALKDSDAPVRQGAAEALGLLGSQLEDAALCGWVMESLIATLKDGNEYVQSAAAEALGELGDVRAVEPLIAALKDDHEDVRLPVTEVLGRLGAQLKDNALRAQVVELLIAVLKDEHESLRRSATRALGQLWQLPELTRLASSEWNVRSEAAEALGNLEAQLDDAALRAQVVELLIAALKHEHESVRRSATRALGQIRHLPDLTQLGSGDHRSVRQKAAEALGEVGDEHTVEPLIAALKDSHKEVRSVAACALGKLRDARAVEPLITALEDKHGDVRQSAGEALRHVGTPEALAAVREWEAREKGRKKRQWRKKRQ